MTRQAELHSWFRLMMWRAEDMALAGGLIFDPSRRRGFMSSASAWDAAQGADFTASTTAHALLGELVVL